ncbi:putative zinc finger BED domain-containing protein 1-like [Apostichopus japonicus]|uniref:Putative zinc finger BED domain-containing protein 1-like n=1 Tax=Stichopus japonicus TaxID=307972 RepID=A0A2G8JI00_STIJA|nr:putative zinc finger BED domain-containing protein 1-like [Apostichopus japonicus]
MAAKDGLPLSFVDGKGFSNFMASVLPGYKVPCRKTITATLNGIFIEKRNIVQKELDACPVVALTTDCWTSRACEGFMTVTAHGFTEKWDVVDRVLDTSILEGMEDNMDTEVVRHTAVNLGAKLESVVQSWNIEHVIAVVHDNASNVKDIGEQVNAQDIGCSAHTLQLCITSGLKAHPAISKLCAGASRLVAHFKKSAVATKALELKQKQQSVKEHNLIQSCPTRWNSTYFMLERIVEQRWPICAVLSDRTYTSLSDARVFEMTDEHWRLAEDLVPCLQNLQIATTILSSGTSPTLSTVQPVMRAIDSNHLQVKPNDSAAIKSFKKTVSAELKRRFDMSDNTDVTPALIASAVDPRYKSLSFLSECHWKLSSQNWTRWLPPWVVQQSVAVWMLNRKSQQLRTSCSAEHQAPVSMMKAMLMKMKFNHILIHLV